MGPEYEALRQVLVREAHFRHIEDAARRYVPGRRTVVLVPAGIGSQLDRTTQPVRGSGTVPVGLDPVWLDVGLLRDDAAFLALRDDGRDLDDHLVFPSGPLRSLVTAYEALEARLTAEGLNQATFAYDWRRDLGEAAQLLAFFLEAFRTRVLHLRGEDPLPRTTLLCHGLGGLVAKVFLERTARPEPERTWLERWITVGTPFYGSGRHMARYWEGRRLLNAVYGRARVARLLGSLPGPYALLPTDRATFERDRRALAAAVEPLVDADTGEPLDPYDPGLRGRYPPWVRSRHLRAASRLRTLLTRPLPERLAARVTHVRSGADPDTWAGVRWRAGRFEADATCPLQPAPGPGDGLVPSWSARLASTPDARVVTLRRARAHLELLDHPETLDAVAALVTGGRATAPPAPPSAPRLGLEEAERVAREVAQGRRRPHDPEVVRPELWRRLLSEVAVC